MIVWLWLIGDEKYVRTIKRFYNEYDNNYVSVSFLCVISLIFDVFLVISMWDEILFWAFNTLYVSLIPILSYKVYLTHTYIQKLIKLKLLSTFWIKLFKYFVYVHRNVSYEMYLLFS